MRMLVAITLLVIVALGTFILMRVDQSIETVDTPTRDNTAMKQLPLLESVPLPVEEVTASDPPFAEERAFVSLATPPSGMDLQSMYAAKERMLVESGRAAAYSDDWVDTLTEIIRNEEAEPVGRDYALQHLHTAVGQRAKVQPEWLGRATAHRARSTILYALSDRTSSLSGTALLGLRDLETQWPGFALADFLEQAVDLALDEETALVSRITALRVAAEGGKAEVLPLARSWAELRKPGQTIPALATLGDVGAAQDLVWMEMALSNEPPEWMQPALKGAEQRLLARLHNDNQGDR